MMKQCIMLSESEYFNIFQSKVRIYKIKFLFEDR
jgi:hypothetical protein